MKKTITLLFILLMVSLCACSQRSNVYSTADNISTSSISEAMSLQSNAPESSGSGMTNEEIITIAKDLTTKGNEVFWWYMGDAMGLDVDRSDGDFTKVVLPVGKFHTIAALKAATEEIYSKQFCENILYPVGFNESQGENIKFREIDGVLHINENNGGRGWPYDITDKMTVKSNEADEIVVTIITKELDFAQDISAEDAWFEVPLDFTIVKENGAWKLDNWYEYGT